MPRSSSGADGTDLVATDGRYATVAEAVAGDLELVVDRSAATVLADRAVAAGCRTIAVETHDMSVDLLEALQQAAPHVRWSSLHHTVERLRTTKDATEIELLRHACAITDRAFAEVIPVLRPGLSERLIARLLENVMIDAGADVARVRDHRCCRTEWRPATPPAHRPARGAG